MIMHSGMVPPEIELKSLKNTQTQYTYITGTQDQFRSEPEVVSFVAKLKSLDADIDMVSFNGDHRIDIDSVKAVLI